MDKQAKIEYLEVFLANLEEWFELQRNGPAELREQKEDILAQKWGIVCGVLKDLNYKTEVEITNDRGTKIGVGDIFHDGFYSQYDTLIRVPNIQKIRSYVLSATEALKVGHVVRENILPSVTTLLNILNSFPDCVSRLKFRRKGKNKLEVTDEYDVQDIIYLMLKGVFPTLQSEDPAPKVGPNSSKADFTISDLGIYLETKYITEKGKEKTVHDECLMDIQKYGKQENCQKIIFFVYDPNKCIDNVYAYKAGLGTSLNISGREIEIISLIFN